MKNNLRVGDWVEVRSKEDILKTLDVAGELDGMPFMPEMLRFCGQKFQVYKRAHKSCDPDLRSRRLERTVHLETRCEGEAHGGCQAGCLFFWKEAWLKPVEPPSSQRGMPSRVEPDRVPPAVCTDQNLFDRTETRDPNTGELLYVCQATRVETAGKPIKWWDLRQYIEDYFSGNVSLWRLFSGFVYSMYYNLSQAGTGAGPAMRWFYNKAYPLWRGTPWPRTKGVILEGQPTPSVSLNLQPGELVRIKPQQEILQTVTTMSKNRGLWWDAELVPYCGKTYRVLKRVTRVIDEKTGKMLVMKTPSIILDSVICQARYSACRMFCPRSTFAYWREIWLERVGDRLPDQVSAPENAESKPSSPATYLLSQ